jgi:hypothetical protein
MLLARESLPPLRVIERLIGLQAQQPRPPFIGLWTRLADFEPPQLLQLIHERKVVRGTMMRATLHLVASKDYLAFRGSVQPALTAGMQSVVKGRKSDLDIEAVVTAAKRCFSERPQTFSELREALSKSFPGVDERAMGYVARTRLPLILLPNDSEFGFGADSKFASADSWIGKTVASDDQTPELVVRYLAAFGPATIADAQIWSGLRGLKPLFEALRPELITFRDERGRELFDVSKAPRPSAETPVPVRFLPAFDNAILAHADRSRIIADDYRPLVVTKNLQVLPTFLVNGFVGGTWAFARSNNIATITMSPFTTLTARRRHDVAAEAERLLRFLAKDAVCCEVVIQDKTT